MKKLQQEMAEKNKNGEKDYAYFSFEGNGGEEEFLISLSKQIMMKCKGVKFDVFYTAMIKLFQEQGRDITRLENEIDSALKSGLKKTAFEAAKDVATMSFNIPVVGSIAAAVSSVYGGVKPLVEKKIKENGSDKKDRKRETGV